MMTKKERRNHAYLGDGVYAEFDGYHIVLRANHHTDQMCTDKIYLDEHVIACFNDFMNYIRTKKDDSTGTERDTGLLDNEIS
jgi:hypothetical protein